MKFPASFKQSLTLSFVVVATLPILLLGWASVHYFEKKHLETVSGLLNLQAVNVSNEASEFLRDTYNSLALVEKNLNSNLLGEDDEINRYLQLSVNESSSFESIFLLDENDKVTHLGLSSHFGENRQDYFDLDLSAHVVFANRHRATKVFWSDTFLSTTTAEPSVTLAISLETGTLLGTVGLKKISTELLNRLDKTALNISFSLLDHHGVLIADSHPERVSQRLNLLEHPEIREALEQQIEVYSQYHEDHSRLESVQLVKETGWAAYVSLPVKLATQGLGPLRLFLFSSLTVAALFGICLSLWLSRRMLKPILLLRDAVSDAGRGHYGQVLQTAHYEELEDLSGSFRQMIAAVDEREKALRDNRARYRDLVNSIDGIVWELELATFRFTYVSDQVESILGHTSQQWLEEQDFWLQHIHHEDREWVLSFCATETNARRDHDFEYRMLAGDGRIVWLKNVVSVIVEDDKPVRLRGVMLDITERKKAELELQETSSQLQLSESRFRTVFQINPDVVLISRIDSGVIIDVNESCTKVSGYSRDEIIGKTSLEVGFWANVEDRARFIAALCESGHVENMEMLFRAKDGREKTGLTSARTLMLNNELCVLTVIRDITAMKDAETRLVRSESHLQSMTLQFQGLLEAIPDQIMVLDRDMRMVWRNRSSDKAQLGYEKAARIPCYETPEVECGPASGNSEPLCDSCPVKKTFASGNTEEAQVSLADGRTLYFRPFPVFDEQGEVVNVIEIVQDISESLRQRAQHMRTGQLAALGELAAGVAHEINNPINGVINYAQLILNQAAAESREEELSKRIIRESERVATIVRELLYFSRAESQQVEKITVLDALKESLALAKNQLDKEGVSLQIQLPDNLPLINSRSHQIQRLFLNLISNARYALSEKYPDHDPNKILLVKGEEIVQDNQTFVSISFRDQGTGIPADLIERVLNPFVTTKAAGVGTGLGLSISHEIVQKHGGELNISSREGEFTEVRIILPAV